MFRPLHLFTADDSIPCPALRSSLACTVPRCLFSHDFLLDPTPPPPSPEAPAPAPRPPVPLTESERRLREIVEGKKPHVVVAGGRSRKPSPQVSAIDSPDAWPTLAQAAGKKTTPQKPPPGVPEASPLRARA